VNEPAALAKLDQATRLLAEAKDLGDVKPIIDIAQAAATYARAAKLGLEAQNHAAELKLRAERRAGELLIQLERGRAGRPGNGGNAAPISSPYAAALADAGANRREANRWQLVASVPVEDFEREMHETMDAGNELTTSGLLGFAKALRRQERLNDFGKTSAETCAVEDLSSLAARGPFRCLYADPPWQYGNQATRASTDNHYLTMSVEDICALPIPGLVATDAHLHLWTTNAFIFEAKRVMEAWGFEYKSCLVWVKPQMGIGNYWRVSHEFMLLGVRGDCPFLDHSAMSWIEVERGRHSSKPEQVRALIERVSPGPRLELFGRRLSEGWAVWGNEIERSVFEKQWETEE
jgi:N6-adenosine-specific RNA methylase IME4